MSEWDCVPLLQCSMFNDCATFGRTTRLMPLFRCVNGGSASAVGNQLYNWVLQTTMGH